MKKTFSVNLGNRVFYIDEDAYFKLKAYLDTIERYFSDEKERLDIINDIEMRLSELFTERVTVNRQVITLADVSEAIHTMGNPQEIVGEGKSIPDEEPVYESYPHGSRRRRLYRDDDNRVIGGVCSGLGAYFDIDPVIIRIVLLVLFFLFGFGLLLYLILWIVVPKAVTTAQKLEMRGDPVNASNIGNFVREEFDSVKKSFQKRK